LKFYSNTPEGPRPFSLTPYEKDDRQANDHLKSLEERPYGTSSEINFDALDL
jgi:hypothetical protein